MYDSVQNLSTSETPLNKMCNRSKHKAKYTHHYWLETVPWSSMIRFSDDYDKLIDLRVRQKYICFICTENWYYA